MMLSIRRKSSASVILATLLAIVWLARPAHSEPVDANNEVHHRNDCAAIPLEVLKRLHAAAMDHTYMSADPPYADTELPGADFKRGRKIRRTIHDDPTAFEHSDAHFDVVSELPAWDIVWNTLSAGEMRYRREPLELKLDLDDPATSTPLPKRNGFRGRRPSDRVPWRCESQHEWIRLSMDFYPRFLRTVQCTRRTCWLHGNYECTARRASVQLLQRHMGGGCADAANLRQYGFTGATAEQWRWVQAEVNFYCECAKRKGGLPF